MAEVKSGKNKGKIRSKSGKLWTKKAKAAYYATDGFKRKPSKKKAKKRK